MRLLQLTYLVVFVGFVAENYVFEAGSAVFAHPFAAIDAGSAVFAHPFAAVVVRFVPGTVGRAPGSAVN